MRKTWPAILLAVLVAAPTAVAANKNSSAKPTGGGSPTTTKTNHSAACHKTGTAHTTTPRANVTVNVTVNVRLGSVTPFGSTSGHHHHHHAHHKCETKSTVTMPTITAGVSLTTSGNKT